MCARACLDACECALCIHQCVVRERGRVRMICVIALDEEVDMQARMPIERGTMA